MKGWTLCKKKTLARLIEFTIEPSLVSIIWRESDLIVARVLLVSVFTTDIAIFHSNIGVQQRRATTYSKAHSIRFVEQFLV